MPRPLGPMLLLFVSCMLPLTIGGEEASVAESQRTCPGLDTCEDEKSRCTTEKTTCDTDKKTCDEKYNKLKQKCDEANKKGKEKLERLQTTCDTDKKTCDEKYNKLKNSCDAEKKSNKEALARLCQKVVQECGSVKDAPQPQGFFEWLRSMLSYVKGEPNEQELSHKKTTICIESATKCIEDLLHRRARMKYVLAVGLLLAIGFGMFVGHSIWAGENKMRNRSDIGRGGEYRRHDD